MNRDQKAAVVEDIARQLQAADAIFAVDYRGLSVPQAADLRARLHDAGATFRVVKNSLTERATEQAGAEQLKPLLEGPTALALVEGDAALAAKALNDTARTLRMLEFKGGIMNGSALSAEEIRSIARLPAREVLHAQLVGAVASPLAGLARTLNALIAGVAVQLQQVAEQGLIGEAPGQLEEPAVESSPDQPEAEQAATETSPDQPEAEQAATETSPDQPEAGTSEPETDEPPG
jgi:large subunit ribosomal protein L10